MCHGILELIKINKLIMRTEICKEVCNKFTSIITINFFNNWSNEQTEYFCSFGDEFDWVGSKRRLTFLFLSYFTNKASFQNFLSEPFKPSSTLFGVIGISGRQTSRCETTGLTGSNI